MITKTKTAQTLEDRQHELDKAVANAKLAKDLEAKLPAVREELERTRKRYDAFVALGNQPARLTYTAFFKGYGTLEVEPVRSRYTGTELAAQFKPNVDNLEAEVAGVEAQIEELLS